MSHTVETTAFRSRRTVAIARSLLGKFLIRSTADGEVARMITEVEAYDGERDLASHARRGRTPRNAVMYEPGGVWYVYLCYGVHEMLNLVTGPLDYPAAVLIRGVEGFPGPGRLTKALGIDRRFNGAVCTPEGGLWIEDRGVKLPRGAINLNSAVEAESARRFDRLKAPSMSRGWRSPLRGAEAESARWCSPLRGVEASTAEFRIKATPRIGVDYAGPVWAKKPWRFVLC